MRVYVDVPGWEYQVLRGQANEKKLVKSEKEQPLRGVCKPREVLTVLEGNENIGRKEYVVYKIII